MIVSLVCVCALVALLVLAVSMPRMSAVPPPPPNGSAGQLLQAIDRLATRIIGSLHGLIGVSYSDKFEHFVNQVTINFADAAAIGTVGTGAIRISQEAAFFCTAIRCNARLDDTGNVCTITSTDGAYAAAAGEGDGGWPDAPFLLQIQDGGNDRLLHNEPVDAAMVYGTHGGSENKLGRPKLFKPNSTVVVTATMLKAAGAGTGFDVRVALVGFKVFKGGAGDATVRVQ